jgi:hypothetical protein
MQSKGLLKEIGDPRFGALADQFIRSEPVDLVSGETQLAVSRQAVFIMSEGQMISGLTGFLTKNDAATFCGRTRSVVSTAGTISIGPFGVTPCCSWPVLRADVT